MNLVGVEFLGRVCFYRDSWLPARSLVKEAICKRKEVRILLRFLSLTWRELKIDRKGHHIFAGIDILLYLNTKF